MLRLARVCAVCVLVVGATGAGPCEKDPDPDPNGGGSASLRIYGINFSPYIDGQDPSAGSVVPEDQLRARMKIVKLQTTWIRSFGCSNGLERTGAIARELGLKAAIGAWIGPDASANEAEIARLIAVAQSGEADLLIVGSEALLRGDISEATLLQYIARVKREAPGLPVTYADVYGSLLSHLSVIAAVDVVLVNYYPYWEGISIDAAMAALHGWHQRIAYVAAGKRVVVGETGWPSAGDTRGQAVPSPENAAQYFLSFVTWAQANKVDYFYFEAFDETWKAASEGPQGAHWGVWDKDGNLKPGMEMVFNRAVATDNWSSASIPGGPGEPAIEFERVPALGSSDDLEGRVWHVDPSQYCVGVYIYVNGWWPKPTYLGRWTHIGSDGSWRADITTGGLDTQATKIAAFVVPKGYELPLGGTTLPAELYGTAVANIEVTR